MSETVVRIWSKRVLSRVHDGGFGRTEQYVHPKTKTQTEGGVDGKGYVCGVGEPWGRDGRVVVLPREPEGIPFPPPSPPVYPVEEYPKQGRQTYTEYLRASSTFPTSKRFITI